MDPRRPCFFDGAALSGQAAWNGAFLYKKAGLWGPRRGEPAVISRPARGPLSVRGCLLREGTRTAPVAPAMS